MSQSVTRLGIAINLNQLRDLMREFVSEVGQDPDLQVQLNWTFETFLQWLRQCQRESVAEGYGHSHGKRRAIPDER